MDLKSSRHTISMLSHSTNVFQKYDALVFILELFRTSFFDLINKKYMYYIFQTNTHKYIINSFDFINAIYDVQI